MSTCEIETALRRDETALKVAIRAYNAVWQSWQRLDATTVDDCRRAALSAAIAAHAAALGE